jgi:hypothetical protein
MTLDRRKAYEIAQALLRARNKNDKGEVIEDVAHTGVVPGEGGYGEPRLERLSSQSHPPLSAPPSLPFRDPSQLADLPNISGRPSGVNTAYSIQRKPAGGYSPRKAYGPNNYPAPYSAREFAAGPATQMGPGETEIYQSLRTDLGVQPHISGRQSRRHDGTGETPLPGHSDATSRQADGELGTAKQVSHQGSGLPKIRYPTSGEIVSEFLGGIGKGFAQTLADAGFEDARQRLAMVDGIYIDTPTPEIFGPPISSWDHDGRTIAQAISVVLAPATFKKLTKRRGKRIGRVSPPTHLKPGTTPYGNYMHAEIAKFVKKEYPRTEFHNKIGRGQTGIDMSIVGGLKPDFDHLDIKTNKRHSERQIKRQIQNWGYDESTVKVFSYDELGNVYEGFDY